MIDKKMVEEALCNSKVESFLFKANDELINLLGDEIDIFEIIEEGLRSRYRPPMYITDALIGRDDEKGFVVEFTDNEGNLLIDSAYKRADDIVGVSLVERIREMAYMGYELKQSKDKEVKEVFK